MERDNGIKLEMNAYLPLRDVVFQSLRTAILQGELSPGERLMEIHLADQLGVSRTPVREALRKLELEGLVMTLPRRGAVVAEIAREDLEDVLEVRAALEELAVRKACENMNEQQYEELLAAQKQMEDCLESGDVVACANADAAFHEVISSATGNRRLIEILAKLRGQMYRYRLEHLKDQSRYAQLNEEHERLCQALKERDGQQAAEVIRRHIAEQRSAVIRRLRVEEE
ncbi:MAG: GntR family transcriptional regulator [Lachnospiraceae bacterium]|nr:GntR family transcriptional regulator [Lachnospiraceae bacterium]